MNCVGLVGIVGIVEIVEIVDIIIIIEMIHFCHFQTRTTFSCPFSRANGGKKHFLIRFLSVLNLF